MNFAAYREILAVGAVRNLLVVAMLARVPHAAAGVLLTLHVVETMDLGYAAAGIVAAAITIGMAFGAPWRGRLVDIYGLRRALAPSVIAEVVVWSTAPFLNFQLLIVAAFIGGLFAVPIFSVVRQALGVMVPPEQRRTAYALDSMGGEITFMIGPATGVVLATSTHTVAGLIIIGVTASMAGVFLMWLNPPTRTGQKGSFVAVGAPEIQPADPVEDQEAPDFQGRNVLARFWALQRHNLRWINLAILAILGTSLGAGLVLAGTNVGMVATMRHNDRVGDLGIVFFFWCGASIVGGIIYGALKRSINPLWLLGAMAVLIIPMGFATNAWTLGLLCILPGLVCAPLLTSSAEHIADMVSERRRGEAMGWYGSSLTLGSALGAPFAGAVIDGIGSWAGFAIVGAICTVLAAIGLIAMRSWQRGVAAGRLEVDEELNGLAAEPELV
ncbi:MFS transporter [Arthrobacter sp. H35-D1]|uniref:MFS transporter n=1 Tax=Arthrobacter sp. H35-D1 TaxID=3046202 RepID=UPI0024B9707D|nr:MFS transporter [Arthrobacter sp. H35-D1]MDJ0313747.1 MFS transporter [Arthrobacter sp. H35-D1]